MPDDFQQLKGFLGHQIAKFHLRRINGWSIVGEEVRVDGVDARARLDMVVQRGEGIFSPVEVKFQEYRFERYGVAFEYVLNELGNGRQVYGVDKEGNRLKLTRPILYLWFPPSSKIVEIPFYSAVEVIVFEEVLRELKSALGDSFIEEIAGHIKGRVEEFLRGQDCVLSESRRRALEELFPDR